MRTMRLGLSCGAAGCTLSGARMMVGPGRTYRAGVITRGLPVVRGRLRRGLEAVECLAGGLGTALAAAALLVAFAVSGALCVVVIGVPLTRSLLAAVDGLAERERERLARWGHHIPAPEAGGGCRRRLAWLVGHGTLGLATGLMGALLPVLALRDLTFPLWWRALPDGEAGASLGFPVDTWPQACGVGGLGAAWLAVALAGGPALARLQAFPAVRLLGPPSPPDAYRRIAELSATRAAALRAHAAELRRIERALHDGAQNRLVGVVVLAGVAERALERDPAAAREAMARARDAARDALGELRGVVRGILPPVLESRGLDGALDALAAHCPVPCTLDVSLPGGCPVALEATAYFVVAEALTNVARHSAATRAAVSVRREANRLLVGVHDDGRGGAVPCEGSGLDGVRRRVEAHDGRLTLTSPPGGPTVLEAELPCAS